MENRGGSQYTTFALFVILADDVPVLTLFLLVGLLHFWHCACPDYRLDQVPSGAIPCVGYCL